MSDYFFDYLFPLAIEFGMTSEEFWKDDPKLFSSYQKAYIEKEKRKAEMQNYSNWLQGLYIHNALSVDLNNFGYGFIAGKKPSNNSTYPTEPYDLFGNKKDETLKRKKIKRQENQKNLNFWARLKK